MSYSDEIKKIRKKMFSVSRSFWERNWSFLFINKPLGRWQKANRIWLL